MAKLPKVNNNLLQTLKASLVDIYHSRLASLYLYGSYARGEARKTSDLDVAMVLDHFERPWVEIQRTSILVSTLSLKYGMTISLLPFRLRDWKAREKSLIRIIQREGIAV